MNFGKPVEWTQLRSDELEEHSLINCPLQHECLSLAARESWRGFSCKYCQIFEMGKEAEEAGEFEEFFTKLAPYGTGERW